MNFIKQGIITFIIASLCSGLTCPPSVSAKDKKIQIKMASLAPKNVGWAKHIREIIHPAIEKATGGNVKLKWYWGGVMGNDEDYLQKMRIGQLQGGAFTGRGVVLVCPEMAVLELPFMFSNYEEVDYIRKKMFPTFDAYAEKRGYKMIAWADQDFDQIYSVKWKMDKLEDFRNARFLSWYGTMEQKLLTSLGSSPSPVNVTELTPSLRQGVGDTMIAPAIWVVGSQLYTVIKYVNPIKIRYSPAAVFVTMDTFTSLPESYQKNILAIRDNELNTFIQKSRIDSEKSYQAMLKYGMKETRMRQDELTQIREKAKKIWAEMAGRDFPKELLDELQGYLAEFRSALKNSSTGLIQPD